MKVKVYIFRAAVALLAFGLATGLLSFGRYLTSVWRTKPPQISALRSGVEFETAKMKTVIKNAEYELSKAEENSASNTNEYVFDGEGDYFVPGDLPKGFENFGIISIETRDWEAASFEFPYGVPIPPKGYVYSQNKFEFERIGVSGNAISFETEIKKGIRYEFTGTFLKETVYEESVNANIRLEGHLIKLRNGKKIAEAGLRLAVDETCGC